MKRFPGLIILMSFLMAYAGCRADHPDSDKVKRPQISGVTVQIISPSKVDEFIDTSGSVKAKSVSIIASRVMGTVTSIQVREGDRVKAGQILAAIDDSDSAQRLLAAEKAVESAKQLKSLADATYRRYRNLYEDKALSAQEFDQIETQKKVSELEHERAKAMMQEAKIYHGFTRITAPLSGVVTEKRIELGSTAIPGAPVFTVEDTSSYRVEVNMDEKYLSQIRPGIEPKIYVESIGREITGKITDVVPSVDPATRTFPVKIAIAPEGVRNGSYVKVSIPAGSRDALLLPLNSIVERGQLSGAYVVGHDSVITYRLVRTGRRYGDKIEILSGLNAGERVITGNVEKASDGGILLTEEKRGEKAE